MRQRPSPTRIRALLDYDRTTGLFRWKRPTVRQAKGWFKGNKSGVRSYRRLWINGHHYLAHVIAFVIVKGRWPRHEIARRDRDQNNRWSNLRELPHSKVVFNRRKGVNNTTGYRGVSKYRTPGGLRFRSAIHVHGQRIDLGLFDAPARAAEAWLKAAKEIYGDAYVA